MDIKPQPTDYGDEGKEGGEGLRSRGPEPATSPRPPEVQGIATTSLPKGVNAHVTFRVVAGSVDSQRWSRRSSVVIVHCLSGFLAEWRVFITILHAIIYNNVCPRVEWRVFITILHTIYL